MFSCLAKLMSGFFSRAYGWMWYADIALAALAALANLPIREAAVVKPQTAGTR